MTSQMELFKALPPDSHRFTDPEKLKEFILAGKAKVTLQSQKTYKHFTYKIKKSDGLLWWVSRLGSEDVGYIYLGTIRGDSFSRTKKTLDKDFLSDQFRVWNWFWTYLTLSKGIPNKLHVYHEGRCGMCGLELTDPLSIQLGYGPDCRRKKFKRPAERPPGLTDDLPE